MGGGPSSASEMIRSVTQEATGGESASSSRSTFGPDRHHAMKAAFQSRFKTQFQPASSSETGALPPRGRVPTPSHGADDSAGRRKKSRWEWRRLITLYILPFISSFLSSFFTRYRRHGAHIVRFYAILRRTRELFDDLMGHLLNDDAPWRCMLYVIKREIRKKERRKKNSSTEVVVPGPGNKLTVSVWTDTVVWRLRHPAVPVGQWLSLTYLCLKKLYETSLFTFDFITREFLKKILPSNDWLPL